MQGQNGSHFEAKPVPPPLPNKCDWEIDPSELDFSNSAIIGKVGFHFPKIVDKLIAFEIGFSQTRLFYHSRLLVIAVDRFYS